MGSGTVRQRGWHVTVWPPLAWLETGIRLVALAAVLSTFTGVAENGEIMLPQGVRLAQWIILVILTLGLSAVMGERLLAREVVSIVFAIVNNAAHWLMVLAVMLGDSSHLIALFATLMLAGALVKLSFIAVNRNFTVHDQSRLVLYGLTSLYATGYGLILLLETLH